MLSRLKNLDYLYNTQYSLAHSTFWNEIFDLAFH
jgi:hypothetical protein